MKVVLCLFLLWGRWFILSSKFLSVLCIDFNCKIIQMCYFVQKGTQRKWIKEIHGSTITLFWELVWLWQRTPKQAQIGDLKVTLCFVFYESLAITKRGACGDIFEWIMDIRTAHICLLHPSKRATTPGQTSAFITNLAVIWEDDIWVGPSR